MIHTVTVNPSLDYYLTLPPESLGPGIYRAQKAVLLPGSKGLNVSMMLSQLQVPSRACFFCGGFTGEFLKAQLREYPELNQKPVMIAESNRINVKVRSAAEMDLNAPGPIIPEVSKREMTEVLEQAKPGDWVLVCGSLGTLKKEWLKEISDRLRVRGVFMALDIDGLDVDFLCACRPALIKPNREEFKKLFPEQQNWSENYHKEIEVLRRSGIGSVLISLGEDGALLTSEEGRWRLSQPSLMPVNTVGAGDSMLAGLFAALSWGESWETALKWGGAAGAATAICDGLANRYEVEKQLPLMRTVRL